MMTAFSVGKANKDQTSLASPQYPRLVQGGRSLVWSRTSACHADDPGSNLGDRTNSSSAVFSRKVFACFLMGLMLYCGFKRYIKM
jgi:hypothetical protein